MRVVLLRHGPAEAQDTRRWPDDHSRPLTPKGEARVRIVSRALARLEGEIHAILTSPFARCMRTAELLHEEGATQAMITGLPSLAPGRSWRATLQRLAEETPDSTVVLVGHEPELGKLAGLFLFGAPASLPLKKAGACAFSFDEAVAAGAGRLRWFLPPRALARLAPSRRKA
ncbi:MAG: phosphohistidine phosphatase SixA [Candidatus Eisenbacteria bacterium]|jgi:phosphohistidine phosphatase|nr:phosphohistidine phosphatase SixA [Candidatus Eisenbacteria bacterium]